MIVSDAPSVAAGNVSHCQRFLQLHQQLGTRRNDNVVDWAVVARRVKFLLDGLGIHQGHFLIRIIAQPPPAKTASDIGGNAAGVAASLYRVIGTRKSRLMWLPRSLTRSKNCVR